jgi:P2 family phage major capsid protein
MKALSPLGYDRFSRYLERVSELNDLPQSVDPITSAARTFAVTPSIQQVLVDKMTEDTGFLSGVGIFLVPEIKGEKLNLGLDGKIVSSRTDVIAAPRAPKSLWALDSQMYECRDTHFDIYLSYAQIDMWARYPDFETRISKQLIEAQRADRIKIGFNGIAHLANTDRVANPLGQDVNVGWLERLRLNAPGSVTGSGVAANQVSFGSHPTADFKTLDALVISAVNELIAPWHVNRTDLVVLVSRDLPGDKYYGLYNVAAPATEQLATQVLDLQHRIGRYPVKIIPWFPAGTIAVTYMANLSIYEQEGSRRRKLNDNAARSRFDNFESFNEDYVIEDYDAMCLIENIVEKNA